MKNVLLDVSAAEEEEEGEMDESKQAELAQAMGPEEVTPFFCGYIRISFRWEGICFLYGAKKLLHQFEMFVLDFRVDSPRVFFWK